MLSSGSAELAEGPPGQHCAHLLRLLALRTLRLRRWPRILQDICCLRLGPGEERAPPLDPLSPAATRTARWPPRPAAQGGRWGQRGSRERDYCFAVSPRVPRWSCHGAGHRRGVRAHWAVTVAHRRGLRPGSPRKGRGNIPAGREGWSGLYQVCGGRARLEQGFLASAHLETRTKEAEAGASQIGVLPST